MSPTVPPARASGRPMIGRTLVAGIGNIFFGDDGFGVEVARLLAAAPPPGARVEDFGIRALHLAYALLEPIELLVAVDCMPRGGAPGTLYVVEPVVDGGVPAGVADAHGMNLPVVFAAVRELGGRMPRTLVVGCEPGRTDAALGLSPAVTAALPAAAELIRDVVAGRLVDPVHPHEVP